MLLLASSFVTASAEVSIEPEVVELGAKQLFSVQVVSEREQPTNGIKIYIPQGVTNVRTFAKDRWNNVSEQDDEGNVSSIEWSGRTFIPSGQAEEFQFLAEVPDGAGTIEWEVEQNYLDNYVLSYGVDVEGDDVEILDPIKTQVSDIVNAENNNESGFPGFVGWLALGLSALALFFAFRNGSKANQNAASGAAKIDETPKEVKKKITKKKVPAKKPASKKTIKKVSTKAKKK